MMEPVYLLHAEPFFGKVQFGDFFSREYFPVCLEGFCFYAGLRVNGRYICIQAGGDVCSCFHGFVKSLVGLAYFALGFCLSVPELIVYRPEFFRFCRSEPEFSVMNATRSLRIRSLQPQSLSCENSAGAETRSTSAKVRNFFMCVFFIRL